MINNNEDNDDNKTMPTITGIVIVINRIFSTATLALYERRDGTIEWDSTRE